MVGRVADHFLFLNDGISIRHEGDSAVFARVKCRNAEARKARDCLWRRVAVFIVAAAREDAELWIYKTEEKRR